MKTVGSMGRALFLLRLVVAASSPAVQVCAAEHGPAGDTQVPILFCGLRLQENLRREVNEEAAKTSPRRPRSETGPPPRTCSKGLGESLHLLAGRCWKSKLQTNEWCFRIDEEAKSVTVHACGQGRALHLGDYTIQPGSPHDGSDKSKVVFARSRMIGFPMPRTVQETISLKQVSRKRISAELLTWQDASMPFALRSHRNLYPTRAFDPGKPVCEPSNTLE